MSRIEDTMVHNNRELDERIRRLVRELRHPVRTRNAAELSTEERAAFGFAPDWSPRQPTKRKRR